MPTVMTGAPTIRTQGQETAFVGPPSPVLDLRSWRRAKLAQVGFESLSNERVRVPGGGKLVCPQRSSPRETKRSTLGQAQSAFPRSSFGAETTHIQLLGAGVDNL
jgi:hypothetical protein